jgi:hypothetical protein
MKNDFYNRIDQLSKVASMYSSGIIYKECAQQVYASAR